MLKLSHINTRAINLYRLGSPVAFNVKCYSELRLQTGRLMRACAGPLLSSVMAGASWAEKRNHPAATQNLLRTR